MKSTQDSEPGRTEQDEFCWVLHSAESQTGGQSKPRQRAYKDPTADTAIGNVMREERRKKQSRSKQHKMQEHGAQEQSKQQEHGKQQAQHKQRKHTKVRTSVWRAWEEPDERK